MNNQSQFGDKEMLNDILDEEKSIIKLYSTGVTESSCQNMRNLFLKNIDQLNDDQYQVFDHMRTLGFYQTSPAQDTKVQQAKQKFSQMQQQL